MYRHRSFLDESPDSRYMCTNSGVWGLSSEASRPVSLQIYNFACTLNVSLLSPTVGQTQKTTARGLSQSLTSYTSASIKVCRASHRPFPLTLFLAACSTRDMCPNTQRSCARYARSIDTLANSILSTQFAYHGEPH